MKKIKPLSKMLVTLLMPVLVLALSAASVFAAADAYPIKPVRLIIPMAPGGGSDIVGRLISTKLAERLGKPVIVENRAGAGGVIGMEMTARSEPDGYTLLLASSFYTMGPALYKLTFDSVKSFTPIAKLSKVSNVLVVHPSVPVNSVKELIALAKKQPGKLIYASAGVGTSPHMGAELFKMMTGIDFKLVQFKGSGPAMVDLLGGHSHFIFSNLTQVLTHIKSGTVKALAIGSTKRSDILPDIPTIAEAGVPGFENDAWQGIIAPAGTPKSIVDRLYKELSVILTSEDMKKMFEEQGGGVDLIGPTEVGAFIEREMTKWAYVVKTAKIKLE